MRSTLRRRPRFFLELHVIRNKFAVAPFEQRSNKKDDPRNLTKQREIG